MESRADAPAQPSPDSRAIELIRSIVVSAEIEASKDPSPGANAAIAWRTIGQIRRILTGDDAAVPAQAGADQIEQILHDHFYTGEPGDLERIRSAAKALRALTRPQRQEDDSNG